MELAGPRPLFCGHGGTGTLLCEAGSLATLVTGELVGSYAPLPLSNWQYSELYQWEANMTIDITTFRESNSLIHPLHRIFYPSKIPQQHFQLKNFISTVDQDTIYFASRSQIYALHTVTRRRERIATLSLLPRCLGAGFGWLCVGGPDKGRCAFINIGDNFSSAAASRQNARHTAEVDALLPLDLDPHSRILAQSFLGSHNDDPRLPWQRAKVEYHELGGDIVNSITVHCLHSGKEGIQDEIVAVIANNDKTIRIFSLSQSRVLQTLEFPTFMNHATISPDGNLLIACGDEPRAFFCKRRRLASLAMNGESVFARYEWHEIADPRLTIAVPKDMCFSTAFSPSGHVCAVASQAGTVTVFDTSLIQDNLKADEAVIDVLQSSRPGEDEDMPGAIRSMAFGPGPWDLFAWAEDRGRICVTDLRNNFQSRQTIELDVNAAGIERAELSDIEDEFSTAEQRELEIEARFVQRHREALDAQDHLAAVNHAAEYMELAAERRRLQREMREAGLSTSYTDLANGLTDGERQILDSLRMERQRRAEREAVNQDRNERPFSVHYLQPSDRREIDIPTTMQSSIPHNPSIRQYMRDRNLERTIDPRAEQPRRRTSVVISNTNPTLPSSSSTLALTGINPSNFSTSPSRLISINTSSTSPRLSNSISPPSPLPVPSAIADPWQTIAAAMTGSINNTLNSSSPGRLYTEREQEATESPISNFERRIQATARVERLRSTRLRQLQDRADEGGYEEYELEMLRRLAGQRRRGEEATEVGTMGIGWSVDGRSLYVGTEEGILEFSINLNDRKTFPALAFR
ncbi:hypothetical protein MMC11_000748 [Xylographa trunciseda]|nr:hypothetical protein [Xylographa trunciseda]